MSIKVTTKISGRSLDTLAEDLNQLPLKIQKRCVTRSLYKAASVISKAARENITEDDLIETGALLKSIGVSGLKTTKEYVAIRCGILRGRQDWRNKKDIDRDAFYGRFLDQGTKFIMARHWLQRAALAQAELFVDVFVEQMTALTEKQLKKAGL